MVETLLQQFGALWASFSWVIALLVFVAYFFVDMLYAYYTLAVARLLPSRAATTGAIMYFLLAVGILNFTQNPLYLLPLALGSWCGTYWIVSRERKKVQRGA